MPMFFVPGVMGKIFRVIPAVVVSVFFISLVECLFILPAHLRHQRKPAQHGVMAALGRVHALPGRAMRWFIDHVYGPVQLCALRWRYVTMAIGAAVLATVLAFFMSGRIAFRFMPLVESEFIEARVVLPYGSPWQRTREVARQLKIAAQEELEQHGGDAITKGIYSQVTDHIASVVVSLVPEDARDITATRFAALWRDRTGDVPGIELLTFNANLHGPSGGAAIDVEFSHADISTLERAASDLAAHLKNYAGVKDIDDGFEVGKPQLDFRIKPEAESLRLTAADLGRQVRDCFYGAEALRQQRGRDEIRVMVRLPEAERRSEHSLEDLIIRTPEGGEVLFAEAAEITRGRAYTQIKRVDGRRSMNVTADVVRGAGDPGKILADLSENYLPKLMATYPGLSREFAGEIREREDALQSLLQGFMVALIVIYAMLAIPFNSFVQPLIVMAVIPFGMVGAVAGHMIMGYDLSIISMFGIVALAGVVVNDSLVLIDAANKKRLETDSEFEAISYAGKRRFRPIVLTSLTTFLGLTPMIFETSIQARFLIPMAISLGYGILFATLIALLLVPSLYLIVEDLRRAARWLFPAR
jgi:multidrug efflux pump subunit AcrB